MIASPCNNCCFFRDNKCLENQFFITNKKSSFAPGFCKTYRSNQWAKGKNENDLHLLMIDESKFSYDLIIIYNEDNVEELNKNINYTIQKEKGKCKKIIICDTIKNKTEQQKTNIVEWFKKKLKLDLEVQFILNIILDSEEKIESTIKNINNQINEKYFAVIPHNYSITGHACLDVSGQRSSRQIFWPFVRHLGRNESNPYNTGSFVTPYGTVYGLYINDAYKKLTTNTETFYKNLRNEEASTGILLSKELDINI